MLYASDAPSARFSSQTGVPAILITTLPHLTDDHDNLFELLRKEVSTWRTAAIGDHYLHLFSWLMRHFEKSHWIERTPSLLMIEALRTTFPGARFVHIVRDGRDASISMQGHPAFRLGLALTSIGQFLRADPLVSPDRTNIDRVPEELRPLLPERFDLEAFNAYQVPLPYCGTYWSIQIENGMKALNALPVDRLLTLRYEDILADPKTQLDALTAFLGNDFIDDAWSTRCAATVRKPRSTWRDLPEEDARALTATCRPGFEQLRAAGMHYDV